MDQGPDLRTQTRGGRLIIQMAQGQLKILDNPLANDRILSKLQSNTSSELNDQPLNQPGFGF